MWCYYHWPPPPRASPPGPHVALRVPAAGELWRPPPAWSRAGTGLPTPGGSCSTGHGGWGPAEPLATWPSPLPAPRAPSGLISGLQLFRDRQRGAVLALPCPPPACTCHRVPGATGQLGAWPAGPAGSSWPLGCSGGPRLLGPGDH